MEEYKWIIITVISFLLALIYDLKRRDKDSEYSPARFDPLFYLKDNWARLLVSLSFSCLLALLVWMVFPELASLHEKMNEWGILAYILIGAAPDLVISYFKRETDFLRPKNVDGFPRRADDTVDPTKPGGPKT